MVQIDNIAIANERFIVKRLIKNAGIIGFYRLLASVAKQK